MTEDTPTEKPKDDRKMVIFRIPRDEWETRCRRALDLEYARTRSRESAAACSKRLFLLHCDQIIEEHEARLHDAESGEAAQ